MKRLMALGMAICVGVIAFIGCGGSSTGAATGVQTEQQPQTEKESSEGSNSSESDKNARNTEKSTDMQKAASGVDRLVFTYVASPSSVPSIIEKNQEIFARSFEDVGISVEYAEINSGTDQTQTLTSEGVQILYAVSTTSVVLSAAGEADIKVLNMYSRSLKTSCMYSTGDSLTIPESLKGKTIAEPAGTNLHELLIAYLAGDGVTIGDVNYVSMGIPNAEAGLGGSSVDVALITGVATYQTEQQGYHMVADEEGLIKATIAVAVRQDFCDANQDVIERFMKAQEEISGFMQDNQEEALKIVVQELDLEEEVIKEMYGYYNFSMEISDEDRDGFQKAADFILESDMIEEALDANTLFFQ